MSLILQDKLVLSPETAEHLQEQIDLLEAASDCADVVGTHADLEAYDTSTLTDQAVVKVLQDETEDDAQTYYRWSTSTETFTLIGKLGPYVNTTTQHDKIYGTDENGDPAVYDKDEFGKVQDVKVDNVSVLNLSDHTAYIDLTGKVDTVNTANKVYGTDSSGHQTVYDKDSFGQVEDVQVDGTSILVNKIANLGTMALEEANDYGVVFRVWADNE